MLNHTSFVDDVQDVIHDESGRFFAAEMPGGGWSVRDSQGVYATATDRVPSVYRADEIIGTWIDTERWYRRG
jgi:hypothetical protein